MAIEHIAAVGLVVYAVMVSVTRGIGWISAEKVLVCVSLPCFVASVWYGYLYITVHGVSHDWGLILSGLGWLAAGLAFVLAGQAGPRGTAADLVWLWGSLAVLLFLAGGVVGWLSLQSMANSADGDSEDGAFPDER